MKTTVKLFANLREALGDSEVVIEHSADDSVRDVVMKLVDEYPGLRDSVLDGDEFHSHINFTLDGEESGPEARVGDADELAVYPPVSGGSGHPHDHYEEASREFAVITVSSSRKSGDDPSGETVIEYLEGDGHSVEDYSVVPDDRDAIAGAVRDLVGEVDAVVTTGGTGLTPDDVTVEAVRPLLDKELPGFGEYFRRLSHSEVGTAAIMTRSTAGVLDGTAVFVLPGSRNAAELGVTEIILPEIDHVLELARR